MTSHGYWDANLIEYINRTIPHGSDILDVGAGAAKYWHRLGGEYKMDAIEVFEPYIEMHALRKKYGRVYNVNVLDFDTDKRYALSIMGDCLEHLTVRDAQRTIDILSKHCDECIFVIPFEYPQDDINDNEFEIHLQPDLTPFNVRIRFPTLYPLFVKYNGEEWYASANGIGIGVYTTKPVANREDVVTNFKNHVVERLFLDLYFNPDNVGPENIESTSTQLPNPSDGSNGHVHDIQ